MELGLRIVILRAVESAKTSLLKLEYNSFILKVLQALLDEVYYSEEAQFTEEYIFVLAHTLYDLYDLMRESQYSAIIWELISKLQTLIKK